MSDKKKLLRADEIRAGEQIVSHPWNPKSEMSDEEEWMYVLSGRGIAELDGAGLAASIASTKSISDAKPFGPLDD